VIPSPSHRSPATTISAVFHLGWLSSLLWIALLSACSNESVDGSSKTDQASGSGEGVLWEAPDLPGPYAMTLDGVQVSQVVLREFLRPDWNRYFLSQENNAADISEDRLAAITEGFYAAPQMLLQPLIRDLLLVRKHEEDHGDVDAHEFEHFVEEFDANAGGSREVLLAHLGEDGLREHLERRFRLRQMMKEFNASTESVSEGEIKAYFDSQYDRVLADMMANSSVSKEKAEEMLSLDDPRVHEMIEGQLQRLRVEQVVDQWILSIAKDTVVTFTGPVESMATIPVQAGS